jgi:tetratricopeptide repeat protein
MPMTSCRVVFCAAILLIAAPGRGAAAGKSESDKAARAHFQQAEKAFNLGNFEEALAAYQAAYAAKPLPGFLFNLAQCQRNLGNQERALFFYRRYLELEPQTPNRAVVEGLIAESEKRLAAQPAAAGLAPAPAAASPPPPPVLAPPPPSAPVTVAPPAETAAAPVAPSPAPAPSTIMEAPPETPPMLVTTGSVPPPPLYRRWWFWATLGGVAAAGVATALLISSGHGTAAAPSGNLGTITWR